VVHQFKDNRARDFGAVDELCLLVDSAGARVVSTQVSTRASPVAATYLGKGQVQELARLVDEHSAGLVVFNHSLSPIQERNLEKSLHTRVLDRTGLILDIFAQRAASHEGKLQVELAQLRHLSTRLIRGWTHLERQKGGIGLRGPGETQLETDRRLIGQRIKSLQRRLKKVRAHRALQRRARKRIPIPVISLVGYTNAGKSTLFNRLTESHVYVADQLFATLDPVMRKLDLPNTGSVILSDTVGFISQLPHSLVTAFHSTLEEVANAALLVHVIDVCNDDQEALISQVDQVLDEIEASDVPRILVFNKIDQGGVAPGYQPATRHSPARVWVSAITGDGQELLLEAIADHFMDRQVQFNLELPPEISRLRASCYQNGWVQNESMDERGHSLLHLSLPRSDFNRLKKLEEFTRCKIIHD